LNPNRNVVGFREFFYNSEIRRIFGLIWIRIQLSFGKAQVHNSSQPTVSHTKVNKYTLNNYLLTSMQTKHQIKPELLVRFGV